MFHPKIDVSGFPDLYTYIYIYKLYIYIYRVYIYILADLFSGGQLQENSWMMLFSCGYTIFDLSLITLELLYYVIDELDLPENPL